MNDRGAWPALPLGEWKDTCATLHMWAQIVGKILLKTTPLVNHWWNTAFHLTPRGWTTGPMRHGTRTFQIDFDFLDHQLEISASDSARRKLPLEPRAVAEFYALLMETLASMELGTAVWPVPVEIPDPIPFEKDRTHSTYDPEYARRHWEAQRLSARVLEEFRGRFLGKCSPVHFFWGSFDLCVTRFSGRRAPARPGADAITREAYSHEAISAGFWPGGGGVPDAAFYAYAAPSPDALSLETVTPAESSFNAELGEFLLPYEVVARSRSPERMLTEFLQSTYEAGAKLLGWDRSALER